MLNTLAAKQAIDPSRTSALRNAFAKASRKRFQQLLKTLNEVVIEDDAFGLVANKRPGPRAFAFPRTADKVAAFMKWFREQVIDDILQVTQIERVGESVENAWTNPFIRDAYKRGIQKARVQIIKGENSVSGLNVNARAPRIRSRKRTPTIKETGGVDVSLLNPLHEERLNILYSRTFTELKGVTDAMEQHIARVLSEGIANGVGPKELARHMVRVVSGGGGTLSTTDSLGRFIPATRRAEMIARTEIIRAHAEAQLTEFQAWGVHGVVAKAEILTTKDERTCPRCLRLEKQVFTIDEARGVIPVHVMCRCIWVPFIEKQPKKGKHNYE